MWPKRSKRFMAHYLLVLQLFQRRAEYQQAGLRSCRDGRFACRTEEYGHHGNSLQYGIVIVSLPFAFLSRTLYITILAAIPPIPHLAPLQLYFRFLLSFFPSNPVILITGASTLSVGYTC